ncbi:ABC transporter ATP-binding protein [Actinospica durhamensis]|uniref:ABC transporter ATP-binding protein n=1 Tax=Actinospica durhamensis TaxID=1508375 RepID=A0A941EPN6_9ACTN|nr:ABC transporter ATP-binding protein [Actinospica durhamensis]MBR7835622.1 ABC transporter ATP-binding protein [Actinospica durhamensis]
MPISAPATPAALVRAALLTRRRDLAAACALFTGHQLGESLVPVVVGAAVSAVAGGGGMRALTPWLVLLAADFALLSCSYRFGARAAQRAKQYAAHAVRIQVVERAVAPGGGLDQPPGALLTLAGSDANRVGAFAGMCASGLAAAIALAASAALLLGYSPLLGAVVLGCVTLLLIAVARISERLRGRYRDEQQGATDAAALAEDVVRGLRVLRGIGAEQAAVADYRRVSRAALVSARRAAAREATVEAFESLAGGCYLVAVAAVGGWLALDGRLSLGHLIAVLGLARFLTGPLQTLFALGPARTRALASAQRILDLIQTPAAVHVREDGIEVGERVGAITFRGAVGRSGRALGFTVGAGRMTGVALDDPAAAADVAQLLAREYDPVDGSVELDGSPLPAYRLGALREAVLVSFHDAALFPGTIAENVGADPAAVYAAAADQVVQSVPGGRQARVGEDARNLSGGQVQRLALARALAAHPPVLVLHEPTTAVDAATADAVAERLPELRKGLTTIVVTTSPALLSRCDQVVFLAAGTDAVEGSHADLIRRDDAYRNLVTR